MLDNIEMVRLFQLEKTPRDDKIDSIETVHTFVKMNNKANREGILSLEEDVANIGEISFRNLMGMMIAAADATTIDDIVLLKLVNGPDDSQFRFNLFILWLGTRLIQKGIHPDHFVYYFFEAFGRDADFFSPKWVRTEVWISVIEDHRKTMYDNHEPGKPYG